MGEKSLDVRMAQSVAPSNPTTSYNNSIPKLGEIIFNNNLNNFKVGNGNTAYGSLANFLGKTITNVSRNTSVTPNTTVITYSDNTTSTIPDGTDGQDGTSVRIQPNAESCVAIGDGYIDTDGNLQVLTSLDPRTFTLAGQIRGPEGPQGATGNGISSISYFYTTTSSQTTPIAEDITSTTIPVLDSSEHKYLWQKEVVNYTNETSQTNISLIGVYGDTGAQGTAGTDGTTPHIDATTGNWFIGSTDTEVHAQGPQGSKGDKGDTGATGAKGDTGETGPAGTNGVTPHIDETSKHWMIGSTDTGIVAEGQQGPAGPQGPQGEQGSQGESGPAGEDGKIEMFNITTWSSSGGISIGVADGQDDALKVGEFIMCVHGSNSLNNTLSNIRIRINSSESNSKYFKFAIYGKSSNLNFYWEAGSWLICRVEQLPTGGEAGAGILRITSIFNNTGVSSSYRDIIKMANVPNGASAASLLKPVVVGNTVDGYVGSIIDTTNNAFLFTFIQGGPETTSTLTKDVAIIKPQGTATTASGRTRYVAFVDEIPTNTVLYAEQELTSAQKAQARTNIGAGTGDSNFDGNYNSLSGKPNLSAVATSGSYNDLTGAPPINDGTLTIQLNGTTYTFSANQATSTTINIEVPNTFETWTFYDTTGATVVKSVCVNSSTT